MCVYVCMYVYTKYVCMCVCVCMCEYVCIQVCVYSCVCVCLLYITRPISQERFVFPKQFLVRYCMYSRVFRPEFDESGEDFI